MLEFLVDNIFVVFAGKVFQQKVGFPKGTNCAPLLADIFFYSYEAEFIQSLLSTGRKQLASRFNFTYRYIDDVLSINNPEFENYLGQMYPVELEIKDTTESNTSASYLDLLLSIERDGKLQTSIYDKHDDFNFHITYFPFLSSNIPTSPAYGVFILQLIRYTRVCSSYGCFILRATRLSNKLLEQGPGVKSRMCPPYPQHDRKRRLIGAVCWNHRIKRVVPCRCLDGHVKEPYDMSMAWEPDRRSNFFFSPPAHAVTYMTEISLIVTLSN